MNGSANERCEERFITRNHYIDWVIDERTDCLSDWNGDGFDRLSCIYYSGIKLIKEKLV